MIPPGAFQGEYTITMRSYSTVLHVPASPQRRGQGAASSPSSNQGNDGTFMIPVGPLVNLQPSNLSFADNSLATISLRYNKEEFKGASAQGRKLVVHCLDASGYWEAVPGSFSAPEPGLVKSPIQSLGMFVVMSVPDDVIGQSPSARETDSVKQGSLVMTSVAIFVGGIGIVIFCAATFRYIFSSKSPAETSKIRADALSAWEHNLLPAPRAHGSHAGSPDRPASRAIDGGGVITQSVHGEGVRLQSGVDRLPENEANDTFYTPGDTSAELVMMKKDQNSNLKSVPNLPPISLWSPAAAEPSQMKKDQDSYLKSVPNLTPSSLWSPAAAEPSQTLCSLEPGSLKPEGNSR